MTSAVARGVQASLDPSMHAPTVLGHSDICVSESESEKQRVMCAIAHADGGRCRAWVRARWKSVLSAARR